jgi:hypothetical protein
MAMLTVYCDDSGTDRDSCVAVVAGYLSNVAQWDIFMKEWTRALKDFGINVMHRSDLENYKGEFAKWNSARRTEFLQRLQPIIRRRTKTAFGCMVIKEDFEKYISDEIKGKVGGVYGLLAYVCLVGISQWCNQPSRQHRHPINWVFEAGTRGRGQVDKMFELTHANEELRQKSRLGSWTFDGKSNIPLQSADVLAYECFKLIENEVVDKGERPVRVSMEKLVGSDKYPYLRFFQKEALEKFATEWGEKWA